MNRLLGKIAACLVRGYQVFISPLTPPSCRYYPTCSEYSRIAFIRHGFFKGFFLTVYRLLRCNPWSKGGFDPVPPLKGVKADDFEFYIHKVNKEPDNQMQSNENSNK